MGYARGIKSPAPFLEGVKSLTATVTLKTDDAGKLLLFDSTTSIVATLPKSTAATKGRSYNFQVKQLTAASGHTVTPQTGDYLHFKGGGAATVSTSAQCTAATDVVGDTVCFVDAGDGNFYATTVTGTWARV
jgi:hypothetical protein